MVNVAVENQLEHDPVFLHWEFENEVLRVTYSDRVVEKKFEGYFYYELSNLSHIQRKLMCIYNGSTFKLLNNKLELIFNHELYYIRHAERFDRKHEKVFLIKEFSCIPSANDGYYAYNFKTNKFDRIFSERFRAYEEVKRRFVVGYNDNDEQAVFDFWRRKRICDWCFYVSVVYDDFIVVKKDKKDFLLGRLSFFDVKKNCYFPTKIGGFTSPIKGKLWTFYSENKNKGKINHFNGNLLLESWI